MSNDADANAALSNTLINAAFALIGILLIVIVSFAEKLTEFGVKNLSIGLLIASILLGVSIYKGGKRKYNAQAWWGTFGLVAGILTIVLIGILGIRNEEGDMKEFIGNLTSLASRIGAIENQVSQMGQADVTIGDQVNELTKKIATDVEGRLNTLENSIGELTAKITTLDTPPKSKVRPD